MRRTKQKGGAGGGGGGGGGGGAQGPGNAEGSCRLKHVLHIDMAPISSHLTGGTCDNIA